MMQVSLQDIIKAAQELDITFELNSDQPGFYLKGADGCEKKALFEDLFTSAVDIDKTISKAMNIIQSTPIKLKVEQKYSNFSLLGGVA
ncbi:MAG TPA: hypothetical protein VMS09_18225 [Paenibacillus sp.]|uniref:hypothetical protein n=1 Tax=Paenibacillus sp. TaxID=58172 RepID=UPI0028D573CC|nr:hypothetical protein [Paenibacillus sp.]HUC93922.1 hypothetical protein [Paenibacillus sp.]